MWVGGIKGKFKKKILGEIFPARDTGKGILGYGGAMDSMCSVKIHMLKTNPQCDGVRGQGCGR